MSPLIRIALPLLLITAVPLPAQVQSAGAVKELLLRASKELALHGTDPAIVEAVRKHNALNMGLAEVRRNDTVWANAGDRAPIVQKVLNNDAAEYLAKLAPRDRGLLEALLMGGVGELVAATGRPDDYWQGDEPKWQRSYAGGKGSVFVDRLYRDEATRAMVAQISVPVLDGTRAIGALTFTVDVAKYK